MAEIPKETGRVLLTGATGQIGRRMLLALTQQGYAVTLVLRRPQAQELELRAWLRSKGVAQPDVASVYGDLLLPDWGWQTNSREQMAWTQQITAVIHFAAIWGWRLDAAQAEKANVQAPLNLWRQASAWPRMTRFVMTIGYMSQHAPHMDTLGLSLNHRTPTAKVDWPQVVDRTGVYEASKLRAYWLMREEAMDAGRSITFIHPATVLGDLTSPEVPDTSAVAQMLQQLAQGKSPLVPGSRRHRVPFVSAGYVSAYVAALVAHPSTDLVSEHLLLDPDTPDLLSAMRLLAKGQGSTPPFGRVPLSWVRVLSKLGPLANAMGLEPESLAFIVEGLFDVNREAGLAAGWGVQHPDLKHLLRRTGEAWLAANKAN